MSDSEKSRIIEHMNKDHKFSLFDYLEHHKGVKLNRSSDDIKMTDISLKSVELNYRKKGWDWTQENIPIVPAMSSLSDARQSLVLMAKESAGALGYSAFRVKSFTPIRPFRPDIVFALAMPFFIVLNLSPDLILPYIYKLWPQLGAFLKDRAAGILYAIIGIHFVEAYALMRPRLNKYRVPYPARLFWYIAGFVEGFPALSRFDAEVSRVSH
ncbi:hypothetical protein AWJ20_3594 [Sugiyamaella lignohabitans]|uniref:DUF2470 domain-containing protein n=1 Tax=Sugiyamaella lignohabitans TaxID=796027 RepID=A0A170QXL8_9ASCO|nr:uncharacterized protein AWJ20_3594 [Sugiyamaella lignohabitans]ANB15947.1 hypothetical protein AWJ20_3594 [Sugiyamaella lignohabitans]